MNNTEKISYVEFPAKDLEVTKAFFSQAFGWEFVDYGPEYTCFSKQGIDGGFFKSDQSTSTHNGSALVVLYSGNLEQTQAKIMQAGGTIVREVFSFPGGRRFHFSDPNGNEYAVWSDKEMEEA
ncbi:VOC family protein [Vibrio sp. Of7-15]|uniref:VOC family protein n=1 Tax=Vibrio sp. Of7-15 TaxID=2724879 RepID=UPI001EF33EEB|nr:VOC family protein [Vibrio sp. Of7-15]MCG7497996.1 VOC family protein [Vibrio sp. Of7-15]